MFSLQQFLQHHMLLTRRRFSWVWKKTHCAIIVQTLISQDQFHSFHLQTYLFFPKTWKMLGMWGAMRCLIWMTFLHNALHTLLYASDPSDENFNCWFSCLLPPELTQSGKFGWSETVSHCHNPLPLRAEDKGSSVSIYLRVMQFLSHWTCCFWSLRLMTVT